MAPGRIHHCLCGVVGVVYRFLAYRVFVSTFWIHLCYFITLAFAGSLALMLLHPTNPNFTPRYVDMFFLSTSALTVSGLATVRMEDLSSAQVVVYTLLMLLGGEVFFSMLGVLFTRPKHYCTTKKEAVEVHNTNSNSSNDDDKKEPWVVLEEGIHIHEVVAVDRDSIDRIESGLSGVGAPNSDLFSSVNNNISGKELKHNSIRYLGYVIMCYHLLFHLFGCVFILAYMTIIPSARDVLKRKGLNSFLFSLSLTISSFANGGLVPTNENMIVFKENSGLLLAVVALVLSGNTLFPMGLRMLIWVLTLITKRSYSSKVFFEHLLKCRAPGGEDDDIGGYSNLLPAIWTKMVSLTVLGFLALQVALFCSMDWGAAVLDGLNPYQKVINALFMSANTRHAGEGTLDISTASAAVNLLFMVMMFLPSSTSFKPINGGEDDDDDDDEEHMDATSGKEKKKKGRGKYRSVQDVILWQIPMIIVFTIAICITERKSIARDPINFSVFNLAFEVISGYGNVGLSIGYGCAKQLHPDLDQGNSCVDQPYSFSGWWSDGGKVLLTLVMLYGRLKQHTTKNGKAWRL